MRGAHLEAASERRIVQDGQLDPVLGRKVPDRPSVHFHASDPAAKCEGCRAKLHAVAFGQSLPHALMRRERRRTRYLLRSALHGISDVQRVL